MDMEKTKRAIQGLGYLELAELQSFIEHQHFAMAVVVSHGREFQRDKHVSCAQCAFLDKDACGKFSCENGGFREVKK